MLSVALLKEDDNLANRDDNQFEPISGNAQNTEYQCILNGGRNLKEWAIWCWDWTVTKHVACYCGE